MVLPDVVLVVALSIFVFLALCGALVLVVISLRRPTDIPLIVAAGLVVLCLLAVTVSPVNVPLLPGLGIALLGTVLAVLGGNPVTRRILDVASHGRVQEGDNGGILLRAPSGPGAVAGDEDAVREVMRGGTTIGYLERVAVTLGMIAGFAEAIAVVVALKGIGRFSELASAEARERFIIGTLASLVWACVVAGLIRLSLW
jgi:hypothetical protein